VETSTYRHGRTLRLDGRTLAVEDEVTLHDGAAELESVLPLAPGATLHVEAHGGGEAVREEGWLSERMHERVRAPVVRARHPCGRRAELGWSLGLRSDA
jgi:hypothetical protein